MPHFCQPIRSHYPYFPYTLLSGFSQHLLANFYGFARYPRRLHHSIFYSHNGAEGSCSVIDGALPDSTIWDAESDPLVGHSPNDPHQGVWTSDPVVFAVAFANPLEQLPSYSS
jgi:hypothetical protein